MNIPRRTFLMKTLTASSAMALSSILPATVMAGWPKTAVEAKTVEEAIMALFANSQVTETDQITIKSPEIAENGAVVPIEVVTSLPQVKSIVIIAPQNPVPLIAQFNFTGNTESYIKTRMKMAQTGPVVTVVKSNNELYVAQREIQVTIGGCSG